MIKLIAGLLDISPTELQERANEVLLKQAQRARRLRNVFAAISAVAVLAFVVALGLVYVAEDTRNAALIAQSRFLARDARAAVDEGNAALGVLLALGATPHNLQAASRPLELASLYALTQSLLHLREAHDLRGHERFVVSAAFSPDGTKIVTASSDTTARLWDARRQAHRHLERA